MTRAGVTWNAPPTFSGSNRYTLHNEWNPLLQWSTGVLSQLYDNMLAYFEWAQTYAKQAVQNLSRVDTGLMRMMADSVLHLRSDIFELNFGWWEGAPFYAPFQEFGTQHISAMLAVHAVFEEIHTGLPRAMGGR